MSSKPSKTRVKKPIETALGQAPVESSEPSQDASILKKPIETSIIGLKRLISLCENATIEVQNYLNYECDILFECRVCRSIFRSLANFILHKRNYCQEKYYNLHNYQNGGYVIENDVSKSSDEESSSDSKSDVKSKKTIGSVIEKLQKKHDIVELSKNVLNEDISSETQSYNKTIQNSSVILQKIDFNESAVFQTLSDETKNDGDKDNLMKSEVMEIHGILENNEAVIGSNGKICNFETSKKIAKSNIPKQDLVCTECNFKFSTKKTLTSHIKYKHNKTCIVFPCPDCKETFANAWSVYRHLYKVHRRTTAQVKRLRVQVLSNAIRKDQEKLKKKPTTTKTILKENEEDQWMNNLESDGDLRMCGGCGKKFERRAALHSHSQTCVRRMAVCNTINSKQKSNIKNKIMTSQTETSTSNSAPEITKGAAKRKQKSVKINHKSPTIVISDDDSTKPNSLNSSHNEDENLENEKSDEIDDVQELKESVCEIDKVKIVDVSEIFKRSNKDNLNNIDRASMLDIIGVTKIEKKFEICDKDKAINELDSSFSSKDDDVNNKLGCDIIQNTTENNEETEIFISDDSSKSSEQESLPSPKSGEHEDDAEMPPKKAKIVNDFVDCFNAIDETFVAKVVPHIKEKELRCISCDNSFPTLYQLMWHMSLHFSWFRFQCTKCSFMSFNKYDCANHAYQSHATSNDLLNSTVLPIPKWKILSMTHDYVENFDVCNRNVPKLVLKCSSKSESAEINGDAEITTSIDDVDEEERNYLKNCEIQEESEILVKTTNGAVSLETIILEEDNESIPKSEAIETIDLLEDDKDPLASDLEGATSSSVNQSSGNRPVRLRTKSYKTIQNDFIYDLAKVLKLNDSAMKNTSGKLKRKWQQKL